MSQAKDLSTLDLEAFVQAVAEALELELSNRRINCCLSNAEGQRAWSRFVPKRGEIYQVTFLDDSSIALSKLSALRVAIELGIKCARPYDLTFFRLELPREVEGAFLGETSKVSVRAVRDYELASDSMIVRLDALVRWNDS